jgi:hypothetical protein
MCNAGQGERPVPSTSGAERAGIAIFIVGVTLAGAHRPDDRIDEGQLK